VTPDRDALKAWYRQAMARRIDELRSLRPGLSAADAQRCDQARAVGQALRGSGATFGFPELSQAAALVETSANADLPRRVEGLIEHLHVLVGAQGDAAPVHAEWLQRAAGLPGGDAKSFGELSEAWTEIASLAQMTSETLAERAARSLGVAVADLGRPARAALRLIPESLMRSASILPLREDSETITVATADPTSLRTEAELERLTGRTPVPVIASPPALEQALAALLDAVRPDAPAVVRRAVVETEDGVPKVLVVDDDASSRLLARTVLEKRGYRVVEATDGVEALERLEAGQPFAVVVADLNMPNMDGLELIWEMRRAPAFEQVPVIVLTGETDEVLETKLIEEGADDYVCKPLDPRLFLARVGATIRRAND